MRYAVVDKSSKTVVNVIELEEGANWKPPIGHEVIISDTAEIGGSWDGSKFSPAPEEPPDPIQQARERALVAIKDNKAAAPWGSILHDLAVGQGWIEAEAD